MIRWQLLFFCGFCYGLRDNMQVSRQHIGARDQVGVRDPPQSARSGHSQTEIDRVPYQAHRIAYQAHVSALVPSSTK